MRLSCVAVAALAVACRPNVVDTTGTTTTQGTGTTTVGLGSASSSGGASTGGCAASQRLCGQMFSYAKPATSVNVYGSFTSPAWTVAVPMSATDGGWEATVSLLWGSTVQYKLQVDGASTWIADPSNQNQVSDGYGGENSQLSDVTCATWTCVGGVGTGTSGGSGSGSSSSAGSTSSGSGGSGLGPFDWRDAVGYFTLTDRFMDGDPSNDTPAPQGVETPEAFQGGDWAGITQQIQAGYFDGLGVNVLWISPPTLGPQDAWPDDSGHLITGYHGYWPYDLTKPESHFGSLGDLQTLVATAHQHGIRVMLDYEMHHMIQSAPLYSQSAGWFWPLANQGAAQCVCGADGGCSWDGNVGTECWFTPYLPAFDYTQSDSVSYTVANALWWVQQTGADAFRLDAVKQLDPSWIGALRSAVRAQLPAGDAPFYMIGETYDGDPTVIAADVSASMLDGQFDFPLRAQVVKNVLARQGSMQDLDQFLSTDLGYYGSQAVMGNFLGDHDVPRAISFAADSPVWTDPWALGQELAWQNQPTLPGDAAPFERMGVAFALVFTVPGMPVIYYGDEIGMNGAGDPDNRHMMYWTGYSSGQQALLAQVRALAKIRAAHSALRRGHRTSLWSSSEVAAYEMSDGSDTVYVALNRSDAPQSVSGLPQSSLDELLSGTQVSGPTVQVAARTAMILVP